MSEEGSHESDVNVEDIACHMRGTLPEPMYGESYCVLEFLKTSMLLVVQRALKWFHLVQFLYFVLFY